MQTYQQQLQAAISNGALVGLTDSQILALAGYGVPQVVPRTGLVNWSTLGGSGVWGADKGAVAQAVLRGMINAGDAAGASQAVVTGGIFAYAAFNYVQGGFNPQDASATAMVASLGAALISATAGGAFLNMSGVPVIITAADIAMVSSMNSYVLGQQVTQSDITAARVAISVTTAQLRQKGQASQANLALITAINTAAAAGGTLTAAQMVSTVTPFLQG